MKHTDDFDDKEKLRDYVIDNIINTGPTYSLKKTHRELYDFFFSLFQRHPEKDRKEVSLITDISIRRFPRAKPKKYLDFRDHQFFIIKNNGSEDSISWNSCVNKVGYPVQKRMSWAMREAIKDQIAEFKNANKNKACELCGTYSDITADHIIKFKKLKEDFLLDNPDHPNEFSKDKFGSEVFRDEDIEFVNLWKEYHKKNAILRILCKNCNEKLDDWDSRILRRDTKDVLENLK